MFKRTILLTLLLAFGQTAFLQAQEGPYHVNKQRIIAYGGAGIGLSVVGLALHKSIKTVPLSELELGTIPSFDEWAVRQSSQAAIDGSNVTLYSSMALPGLLLLGEKSKGNAGKIGLLYFEAMLINRGVTDIFKSVVQRPRPFVRAAVLPLDTPISNSDRASYFSGHTSASATACFFLAQVFNDYYPDSPWRYGVWAGAAVLPALTGYFRMAGGKHYLSDVATGYLVGGAIGVLLPVLHKKPPHEQRLSIAPSLGSLQLSWRF